MRDMMPFALPLSDIRGSVELLLLPVEAVGSFRSISASWWTPAGEDPPRLLDADDEADSALLLRCRFTKACGVISVQQIQPLRRAKPLQPGLRWKSPLKREVRFETSVKSTIFQQRTSSYTTKENMVLLCSIGPHIKLCCFPFKRSWTIVE